MGFDYVAPTSIPAAVGALSGHGEPARVMAGGTDIIIQVRERRRDVGLM
ncbi:MAG: hypothetical protein AB7T37_10525 [Dehalococcoidia bacterium]